MQAINVIIFAKSTLNCCDWFEQSEVFNLRKLWASLLQLFILYHYVTLSFLDNSSDNESIGSNDIMDNADVVIPSSTLGITEVILLMNSYYNRVYTF